MNPTPEQIDALAFELSTMGVHVPPRDTAFFQAAVRKWLASLAGTVGHEQAQASIAQHVREIEILCDQFGYDRNEWLAPLGNER